jgi:hypothetical protein
VYENDQLPSASVTNFEINGDPVAHTVSVTLGAKLITITFSDPPAGDPQAAIRRRRVTRPTGETQVRFVRRAPG